MTHPKSVSSSTPRLNFVLFCEHAIIAKEGLPSFIGVFSDVIAKSVPIRRNGIVVVVDAYLGDTQQHKLKISIKSDAKTLQSFDGKIGPAPSKDKDAGSIIRIEKVEFPKEGNYEFEILIDDKKIGAAPLSVRIEK